MKIYKVQYKDYSADKVKEILVNAHNKEDAYVEAVYKVLKGRVYSAWVSSVIYNNGKGKVFNNFEGKPY